jgi:hypothetical protein
MGTNGALEIINSRKGIKDGTDPSRRAYKMLQGMILTVYYRI